MITADTAVLRCLRIKGRANTADLATDGGVDEPRAQLILDKAAEDGLATHRSGRRGGWMLTKDGKAEIARIFAEQTADLDTSLAATVYDGDFLVLNKEFKQLCTRWQLGADPADVEQIRPELTEIHQRNRELVERLSGSLSWFARYRARFDAAYDRIMAGDTSALVTPLSGSYHDVWIELHEDLLLLLDRVRDEDD
ncbi:MAG TPA: hypothetical protein VHX38_31055 [Pseudonocardiaceae bacterium]|jgi:hypothetical protein|nr:hypothetical protein [Pseudonocardiaceae bacterium]